jgi:hypothetical protein
VPCSFVGRYQCFHLNCILLNTYHSWLLDSCFDHLVTCEFIYDNIDVLFMCPSQYMFSFCEKYHILLTVESIKRKSFGKQYNFQMGAVQVSVLSLVQSKVFF